MSHKPIPIWVLPPDELDVVNAICSELDGVPQPNDDDPQPTFDTYQDYLTAVASLQARYEREGHETYRVQVSMAQVVDDLAAREISYSNDTAELMYQTITGRRSTPTSRRKSGAENFAQGFSTPFVTA